MSEIRATLVESLFTDGGPASPGCFKFYSCDDSGEKFGMNFTCPCGCGSVLGVAFKNHGDRNGPVWTWNGSAESPTVSPSIRRIGGCEWHGHLIDGVFKAC